MKNRDSLGTFNSNTAIVLIDWLTIQSLHWSCLSGTIHQFFRTFYLRSIEVAEILLTIFSQRRTPELQKGMSFCHQKTILAFAWRKFWVPCFSLIFFFRKKKYLAICKDSKVTNAQQMGYCQNFQRLQGTETDGSKLEQQNLHNLSSCAGRRAQWWVFASSWKMAFAC